MTTIDNMKNKFEEMPWDNNDESLKKIKSGQKSLKCGNLAKKACNDVTTTTKNDNNNNNTKIVCFTCHKCYNNKSNDE